MKTRSFSFFRVLTIIGKLFFTFTVLLSEPVAAQDLPSPAANIQTLPVGSYVIAMDNTYQLNSGGYFNLKTYGLIVHLLNNDIKVKWVIRTGKAKDGTDFTAASHQVYPSLVATSVSRAFKGGPFVVFPVDTLGMAALVNSFYTSNSLTVSNRPKIFRTEADLPVDIRYDLTGMKPKAAILNDGGNEDIHEDLMVAAAIPSSSYAISFGKDLISGCYSFASEPHNDKTGLIVDSAIMAIKNFVLSGGNFLAQCAAVTNYENSSYGRFQTNTGITTSYVNLGSALNYVNPDLSYSQFEGEFGGGNGVVEAWTINSAPTNSEHNHATGFGANASIIVSSVSKLTSTYRGGLVYYLGTHDFRTNRVNEVNGIRMYMNAFLTPSLPGCSMSILPVESHNFAGHIKGKNVELSWYILSNQAVSHFEIEKSSDGVSFARLGKMLTSDNGGYAQYSYLDISPANAAAYYRLKTFSVSGAIKYSRIVMINGKEPAEPVLTILGNPVSQQLAFNYVCPDNNAVTISIFNAFGIKVKSETLQAKNGNNNYMMLLDSGMPKGVYYISVNTGKQTVNAKFIKG
jgi:hypothetical protein